MITAFRSTSFVLAIGMVAALVGCQFGGSNPSGPAAAVTTPGSFADGRANVAFSIRVDDEAAGGQVSPSLTPTIRASGAATATFTLTAIHVGAATPTFTVRQLTVPVVGGVASATFADFPVFPILANVELTGATIASFASFRGGLDLANGPNTLVVNPRGSRFRRDVVAHVLEQIASDPALFMSARSGLVAFVASETSAVDRSTDNCFAEALAIGAGRIYTTASPTAPLGPFHNATANIHYRVLGMAVGMASAGHEIIIAPGIHPISSKISEIRKTITIRSRDPLDPQIVAATVLDAGGRTKEMFLFENHATTYATSTVRVQGLTMRRFGVSDVGHESDRMIWFGANVNGTVERCRFLDNWSTGVWQVYGGVLTVTHNQFVGNHAPAVHVEGLTRATINYNSVTDTVASEGFGLVIGNIDAASEIASNTITRNRSVLSNGSAIQCTSNNGGVTIRDNFITENHNIRGGPAISFNASRGLVTRNYIANNTVATSTNSGGGAVVHTGAGFMDFTHNTVTGNSGGYDGGGLYVSGGGYTARVVLASNTFSFNTARHSGGGVFVNSDATVQTLTNDTTYWARTNRPPLDQQTSDDNIFNQNGVGNPPSTTAVGANLLFY